MNDVNFDATTNFICEFKSSLNIGLQTTTLNREINKTIYFVSNEIILEVTPYIEVKIKTINCRNSLVTNIL